MPAVSIRDGEFSALRACDAEGVGSLCAAPRMPIQGLAYKMLFVGTIRDAHVTVRGVCSEDRLMVSRRSAVRAVHDERSRRPRMIPQP